MFDYCMCMLHLYTIADKKKSPTSKWFIVKKCFKEVQRRLLFLFSLFSFCKHFCVKSETGMRKEWFWYTYMYLHVQQPFLNMHKATWLNGWFNHLAASLVYGLVSWWLLYQKGFNLREWDCLMFWIFLRGLLESWHFNLKGIKKAQVISGSCGNGLTISSVFLGLNLCLPRQKEEFKGKNVDWYKTEWEA